MTEKKIDFWLIRIKDILLIAGTVWTLLVWGTGFINLPNRVQTAEVELKALCARTQAAEEANQLFHAGIGKDIEFIKMTIVELKQMFGMKNGTHSMPRSGSSSS